ncbi:MAG: cytosine-specific methylase [Amycolatopsis sp.]|uniref:DNA cytosine methyltransferase n=1 Tax=Amycolatopsis sp. TaxID=37632 RepID=UPI002633B2CF|nr:DNA cytosine methyltransferase [Amycolatopsis sp.]MCU1685792.1 cytosine-specific methylase [Amycolatopsis sp.]
MTYTVTDLFCGAGGSGLGASAVPGVELTMAANHWELAIETHQTNFPGTDHDCADISQVEPRRYRRTSILWASPECTNHSNAKARKRLAQQTLFDGEPDSSAVRSRATMWDVPRFAEHHRYEAIVVENVVEAAQWEMFPAWLMAMDLLGYDRHIVWLNSMHAAAIGSPRAPQSRDRMYVVFWRKGNRVPDLDLRPAAWCGPCDKEVKAVQVFKPRTKRWPLARWGKYRTQYVYRCPTPRCHADVEPYVVPASAVIDWSDPGGRIGDRTDPLEPATMARITAGLARYAVPQLVPAGGTWNTDTTPVTAPFRARTTRETEGLLVPLEARDGKWARTAEMPMRTQSTRAETALVVPYYGTGRARPATEVMPTMTTVDTAGLAFIAELRGGGSLVRPVSEPLAAVCAGGNHHMLVRNDHNGVLRTPPFTGHPEPSTGSGAAPRVEDCTFRMLSTAEIGEAMGFRRDYVICGTSKRNKVRQLGNGVTPPAAELLIRAVVDSLS